MPLFFASAGLHLNGSFVNLPGVTIGVVVALAVGAKLVGSLLAPRLARLDSPDPIGWGLMAKGAVEVALLLVILELDAISEELFSLLTIIMLAYMFIVPKLMERSFRKQSDEEPPELVGVMMPSYARYALDDRAVSEAFEPSPVIPNSTISLESFFRFWMTPEQTDYVVRDMDGNLGGILSLKKVKDISTDRWGSMSLASLLLTPCPTVHPRDAIEDALEKMVERELTALPVVDEHTGELLGELTARNVYALLSQDVEG